MKLVSCYVTGFGQLRDVSFDFTDGLNAICEKNGWGKSTLNVFIKAMFYGMEHPRSNRNALSEIEHYRPWDQGTYGGNLVFEVDGKQYQIERTFGKKQAEDTVQLVDVATGLASSDFADPFGEALFGVDAEAFEKTVYVPQSNIESRLNDSINAKLGNLDSARADIDNFEKAIGTIESRMKEYRPERGKNGLIYAADDEIKRLQEIIDQRDALIKEYQDEENHKNEYEKQVEKLSEEKAALDAQILKMSKESQSIGVRQEQAKQLQQRTAAIETLDDFFTNGIPEESEQERMEQEETQWKILSEKANDLKNALPDATEIEKWNRLFQEGEPSESDIDDWSAKFSRVHQLHMQADVVKFSEESRKLLNDEKHFFARKVPTEDELSNMDMLAQRLTGIEGKMMQQEEQYRDLRAKSEAAHSKEAATGHRSVVILCSVLAIIFAFGGILIHLVGGAFWAVEVVCDACAAVFLVVAIMQGMRIRSSRSQKQADVNNQLEEALAALEESRSEYQEMKRQIQSFLSDFMLTPTESVFAMLSEIREHLKEYNRLLEEEEKATKESTEVAEELANLQLELYAPLMPYAQVYQVDVSKDEEASDLLKQVKDDLHAYHSYLQAKENSLSVQKDAQKKQQLLEQYLRRFPFTDEDTFRKKLDTIRRNKNEYERMQEEITTLRGQIGEETDIAALLEENPDDIASEIEGLQSRSSEAERKIRELSETSTQCTTRLDQISEALDAIEDAEHEKEAEEEKKSELQKKYHLLDLTKTYLNQARDKFMKIYMGPLRERMEDYLDLLGIKDEEESRHLTYQLDMELKVSVSSNGLSHQSKYLSEGMQDLVTLCARFALVDVLYQEQQPVMILDDPFTNLDREKVKRAISLLEDLGKQRQILYFTCHESRMP